ncbi:hypothetical protein [Gaetbulibacter sp. S0825]|uniref:hypothetical protein n=1 Tax=Gaetbulibacter sp. S0825 TaxID=2720084 RepID=UPI0014303545|nr:hypothetical protein [Gaetbulibacter sp. S0825]NIX63678.1 hypothetical protein [Gaetbulibacter sp. S0825]
MKKTAYLFCMILCLTVSSCHEDFDDNYVSIFNDIAFINTYGGSQEDHIVSIVETSDGNLALFGYTNSIDGDITDKTLQENDYWLIKITPDGNLLWSKTYGGSGDDVGQKVVATNDGGFAITGYSMSSDGDASKNEGFHDNWLLKLDANGNILWEKSYGFSGHDHSYSIIQTSDGGFLMTGFLDVTASGGLGNTKVNSSKRHGIGEFWCHKLDANGNIEWRKYFGGTNNDRSFDVVQANDGGYVITGFSESDDFDITNSYGSYDYWVIKLDTAGNLLWEKSLGGSEIDQARSIAKTDDNAYIIAGNSFSTDGDVSSNKGNSDFFIVKIDDNGKVKWRKNYGGSDFDYATSISPSTNGFLLTGNSKSSDKDVTSNYGENDFWVIKINANGKLLDQKNFGGSSLDFAFDVLETTKGDIFIVGETESNDYDIIENNGLKDALVIKVND